MPFFSNAMTTLDTLISESLTRCASNSSGRKVVVLQDSTELNYSSKTGKLKVNDPNIGTLDKSSDTGFFLHPSLVLDRSQGTPLGFSSIQMYQRRFGQATKKERKYTKLPIEQKESYKWIVGAQESKSTLASAEHVIVVADRESDIYDYISTIPDQRTDILVRVRHDRQLNEEAFPRLFGQLASATLFGGIYLEIKHNPKRQDRLAKLLVRAREVQINRPERGNKNLPAHLDLYAIDIKEVSETVPEGEDPIHWRLLSSQPCGSFEEILELAHLYVLRWWIEQLFRTLKLQGLQIESSQLEKGLRLKKLTVMALQVALRIMLMVKDRENELQLEAGVIFSQEEIKFLTWLTPTIEGKTAKQKNRYPPKSLAWATWVIARLGGWKGYKSESPPGLITCRRGLHDFSQQFKGWAIARNAMAP